MPTHNEFREIIMRRGLDYIDTERKEDETDEEYQEKLKLAKENERNREIFVWYWLEVLPVAVPKDKWGIKMRFFGTISGHAPLDNPDDKYITDSDETLIVLMWENCSKRFPYVAKCKKNEVAYDPTNPNYQTRWSNSSAGQNKFGGWDNDGRAHFVELCRVIKAAKRKEHVRDLEEEILKEIQDKYSKVQAEAEEEEGEVANQEREKIN